MAYDIVFVEKEDLAAGRTKAVGESIFLANLPTEPKVFVFFYRGAEDTEEIERRLIELGEKTGDNLFVNIGSLADPDYHRAVERFEIRQLPVIVTTAVAPFSATPDGDTTFVRQDSSSLFARPAELVASVEEIFNLFLSGKVAQAVKTGRRAEHRATIAEVSTWVWAISQPVIKWISNRDISIGIATGTIELKASGAN